MARKYGKLKTTLPKGKRDYMREYMRVYRKHERELIRMGRKQLRKAKLR